VIPEPTPREEVRRLLRNAGWQVDADEPHVIEASDGERYGAAVFFTTGRPVSIEYGDSERDLQHREGWDEAPGLLAPAEVARLFHEERGE
jgi:hypothetical protein